MLADITWESCEKHSGPHLGQLTLPLRVKAGNLYPKSPQRLAMTQTGIHLLPVI